MRDWWKYIRQNKGQGDCQLVTALNAFYHLTGEMYCTQDSEEYGRLMELSGCIAGSATNIERVHKLLGIEVIWQGISLLTLKGLAGSVPLPLEWNTWEWNYGWHSTLIVEWEPRTHSVRATNFSKITGGGGWLFEEDMHQYENFSTMRDYRLFRLFGLRGEPWNRVIKASWKAEQKRWFTMMRDLYNDRLEGKE